LRLALALSGSLAAIAAAATLIAAAAAPATTRTGPARADLYVSAGGSDEGRCTRASPCRSFDRAYRVARPGQIVEVAAGTYPGQTIRPDGSKRSPREVVFRPARGAAVIVTGEVFVDGKHVEFRRMTFAEGWQARRGASDVAFRGIRSGHLFIVSASNVRVIGGQIGPKPQARYDSMISSATGAPPPTNILIDGVYFHDWIDADRGQANHIECLQIGSGVNVVIRRSRFRRCGTHDVFIRSWGSLNQTTHPLRNFTIENNLFDKTIDGYYSIQVAEGADADTPCENFLIRNNSALQDFHVSCPTGGPRGVRVYANILPSMSRRACNIAGSRWDYNVYAAGRRCGAHDRVAPSGFVNAGAFNLRLKRRAAPIDRGNPHSFPRTDFEGHRRPKGRAPDAGADERA
jgi:hypothetical protein